MSQLEEIFYLISLGVFGGIFGSFGNVVIWRLPRGESLSSPGSHCPGCGHPIRWHDNIPIVSWLVLRARCRDCGAPISARYPAVEALSALLFVLAGAGLGMSASALVAVFFFYVLLLLAFIDLDTLKLPDVLVGPLAAGGLLAALGSQLAHVAASPLTGVAGSGWASSPLLMALAGAALGFAFTAGVAEGYAALRGRTGLGDGDVKLTTAMGLYLGPYVLLAVFFGSILSVVSALALPGLRRSPGDGDAAVTAGPQRLGAMRVPFGPFLAAGGVLTAAVGPAVLGWYLSLVGLR